MRSEASTRSSSASLPQLLQPLGLDDGEVRQLQVLEGRAAPQGEGLAEQVRRALRLAERQQLAPAADQALEPAGVHLVRGQRQRVALRGGRGSRRCRAPDGSGRHSPGATCAPSAAGRSPHTASVSWSSDTG